MALNSVISERIEVSPGLVVIRVVPDTMTVPEFVPGQFAILGLPGSAPRCYASDTEDDPPPPDKLITRSYSIASSATTENYLEFYISLVRSGALTPRIFACEVGDRIWLSDRIMGAFTLAEVPKSQHVILIATGTGLAPYMSMLRSELECGGDRHFGVLHGARHSWDLGYQAELLTLERLCPNFTYIPTVSRPDEEPAPWSRHSGYLQDLWRSRAIEAAWGFPVRPDNTHIFLCGNPAMIEDLSDILREEGFQNHRKRAPGQLHIERYW